MTTHGRRQFLQSSLGLGAALVLDRVWSQTSAIISNPTIGIQLYTVNPELSRDAPRTLEALHAIGYRTVESYSFKGFDGKTFRRQLDAAGLACPSAHLHFEPATLDATLAEGNALGATYVVASRLRSGTGAMPYPGDARDGFGKPMAAMTRDDAKQTAELAMQIAERSRKAGLQFCYHNHYFEFVDLGNGQCGYDLLLQETDPDLVKFEIDCGWMKVAGHDPIHYLKAHPHRFPMLHIKDFTAATSPHAEGASGALRLGTELGRGVIDYGPILNTAKHSNVRYTFVEQEEPFSDMSSLDAAQVDYAYLSVLLSGEKPGAAGK